MEQADAEGFEVVQVRPSRHEETLEMHVKLNVSRLHCLQFQLHICAGRHYVF